MALNAKPSVGLEFDSVDTTWQFWVEYGKKCGFGVRNDYLNKRKVDDLITSGRFVCSKEGSRLKDKRSSLVKKPRADTRSGCPVRISFRLRDGKYVIIRRCNE
jgi:zinc finger SWIM domain-containing protein 3